MTQQRFRATEYLAPMFLVLLLTVGVVWLAVRLWVQASHAPPEPQPGSTDYRFSQPTRLGPGVRKP